MGRSGDVHLKRHVLALCIDSCGDDYMDPEGHNCNPTGESMHHFEPVMGSRVEARMSTAQNGPEYQDKYIGSDDVWDLIAARGLDEFSGGKSRVQEMGAAIVEDES
jgi:hypothetical protein